MFYFSPTYLIYMIPAFILMALTSWYVKSAYRKWGRVAVSSRLTGAQAAQRLMSTGNLYGLQIQGVAGELTDHYDPRNKTLYLSQGVGNGNSVASVAIAAHELGHAMQDAEEYFPLRFRSALVPIVNIGSNLGWFLIMIGLFLNFTQLAWLGVIVFAGGAVFALATLPVEFDASARAKQLLAQTGIIQTEEEKRGVNAVLNAAALTYVAGLITAILQLLYYVSLVGGGRRRS
ncbi:MAG: zinc metallopeptidase [Anaerolineales bacterium]|uniref:zinc metallopeptidase n=1 Tax=Candidatus Villigracilis affinis TaxID=3140682 RepID=UPI001B432D24|nr:zinc metallopeptidase [Anaerolineales bacterium]MBK9601570.1 zinc metallopeptidase [Anaerolineales bacterium]MBL0345432.1 zinc metallopeptidase [Anaerolineales bacterium]MBP8047593.1 zinc metallopeptidase [Anaerolineales bacterium]